MFQYSGKCYCAAVVIEFSSPLEISRYRSRLCDCDYCMQRGIEYLSDPKGQISFISKLSLYNEKQGSEQARFLLCRKCQMVVGVCYMDENTCVGNLNSRLLEQFNNLTVCRAALPFHPKS